jgi:dihydrofolate synthase/folylpolyglutamate synthase
MVTSTPPKNADDVYEWLLRFINFERELLRRNFTLDAMNVLAEKAGHPEKCAPSLHVAGSKGKGSVTGMIAAILEASGVRTARYSSPHVSDFRERLSMGNGFFSEEAYALAGKELMALVEDSFFEDRKEPSFFELLTFWFFLCARHARCGAMAVETGMGGRLDATNILDPLASVITLIELEHTEYLGATIEAIAGEKAGIIKPEKPLILAEQLPEALDVFIQHAVRRNSPLFYFPDCVELRNISVDRNGTSFDLILKNLQAACEKKGNKTLPGLFVPVPGEIQAKNAALAILALRVAFPDIQEQSVYKGLSTFALSARFERAAERPQFSKTANSR